MNFNDIFKSSFLENVSSVGILDILLTVALSFGVGLFIYLIYKKTYRGVMYSTGFGTALIGLTMITSIVILAVTSNVVLSLGIRPLLLAATKYSLLLQTTGIALTLLLECTCPPVRVSVKSPLAGEYVHVVLLPFCLPTVVGV